MLTQPLPSLVLRAGPAQRADLLTGETVSVGSALHGPSTRPWLVREPAGSEVVVLRLLPEALVQLGVRDRTRLVDRSVGLADLGLDVPGIDPDGSVVGAAVDRALLAAARLGIDPAGLALVLRRAAGLLGLE